MEERRRRRGGSAGRLLRRIRRWWRETPPNQTAQTLIGLGILLLIVATAIFLIASSYA